MLPQGGYLHLPVHVGGGQAAVDVAHPVAACDLSTVVAPLPLPEEKGGNRRVPLQRGQQGVVSVEDQDPVPLHMGQQLTLGLKDILPAAQSLDMGVTDVGDNPHVRLHNAGQVVDLPEFVHAHLQHTHLVAGIQLQYRKRQADVVIVIPLGLEHLIFHAQHGGQHILGGGFAPAARHADERDGEAVFIPGSQTPQGLLGVIHLHIELVRENVVPPVGGETSGGPAVQGGVDIGVAVEAVPHQGDKQGAGVDGPAVGLYPGDGGVQGVKLPQQAAVHRLQQLGQGNGLHHSPSFRTFRDIWIMVSHSLP